MNPTRRTLLRGALTAGAVGAASIAGAVGRVQLAQAAELAEAAGLPEKADVVVVGGGLSGLATARRLAEQGVGVVVLEARDRAGGRIHNIKSKGGATVDAGAEFVGPTQNKIIELADHYSVKRLDTYNKGKHIWWFKNKGQQYPSWGAPMDLGTIGAGASILEIDTLSLGFPVGRPWEHRQAKTLDSMTWWDWIQGRVLLDSAKFFLSEALSSTLSVRPTEVSALYMMNYFAAAGDEKNPGKFFRLVNVADGAQAQYIEGGAAQIPLAMARDLGPRIVYKAPVTRIATTDAGATVTTARGTIKARKVVVAMSPAIVGKIAFEPGLPANRVELQRGYTMGRIGKFHAFYDEPFWRDAGLTGQVQGDGTPIDVTFESYAGGHHSLMGFVSADAMAKLDGASPEEFRDACIPSLVKYFGPKAAKITDWAEYRWDRQPWSWGGPVAVTKPGTLTKVGPALREPVGPIHWAGTETADYWTGYMDGAIRSGYRAADEVSKLL